MLIGYARVSKADGSQSLELAFVLLSLGFLIFAAGPAV